MTATAANARETEIAERLEREYGAVMRSSQVADLVGVNRKALSSMPIPRMRLGNREATFMTIDVARFLFQRMTVPGAAGHD